MNSQNVIYALLAVAIVVVLARPEMAREAVAWVRSMLSTFPVVGGVMKNVGALAAEEPVAQAQDAKTQIPPAGVDDETVGAEVSGMASRDPMKTCVDLQGQWLSSNLLPKDSAGEDPDWSAYAPGKLENQNFLSAGAHVGMDTVSNSLRNASHDLRSEPVIPKVAVGPWGGSTIDADTTRRSFEPETTTA